MLEAKGKIQVKQDDLRVLVSPDFSAYYRWLIERHFWIHVNPPKHAPHISLFLPKIHKHFNYGIAAQFNGLEIQFEYDPKIQIGGFTSGWFRNFYIYVRSRELDKLKLAAGIRDNPGYRGLHVTVGNTKQPRNGIFFPPMIELR
jgi:hypothetical protein